MMFNGISIDELIGHSMNFGDLSQYKIEIWLGDALIQQDVVQMMPQMMQQQAMAIVHDLGNKREPMKCKISFIEYTEDNKPIENYMEYTNKSWDNAHKKD